MGEAGGNVGGSAFGAVGAGRLAMSFLKVCCISFTFSQFFCHLRSPSWDLNNSMCWPYISMASSGPPPSSGPFFIMTEMESLNNLSSTSSLPTWECWYALLVFRGSCSCSSWLSMLLISSAKAKHVSEVTMMEITNSALVIIVPNSAIFHLIYHYLTARIKNDLILCNFFSHNRVLSLW